MLLNKILIIIVIFFSLTNLLNAQHIDTLKVYYETDEFDLSHKEQLKLNEIDTSNISKISILAFCDDKGIKRNNDLLSIKRANNIKSILLNLNINHSLILETIGKGALPLANIQNKSILQQRKLNRRAEIIITYNENQLTKDNNAKFINLKKGDKIVMENILFMGGRTKLFPESYEALESLTDFLEKNKEIKISILGHICCQPKGYDGRDNATGKNNLSVVRAKAVYDFLIKNGINSNRLTYEGLKADFPLENKEDKFNRRVEIVITEI